MWGRWWMQGMKEKERWLAGVLKVWEKVVSWVWGS